MMPLMIPLEQLDLVVHAIRQGVDKSRLEGMAVSGQNHTLVDEKGA
jgi:hypothetical protein